MGIIPLWVDLLVLTSMKSGKYYRSLLLFLFCFIFLHSFSQSVTGIWKGYFISDRGEQYRLEFQVKENASASVTGVSYSYLDVRFYGKATMTGNFSKEDKIFRIREIRTVEIKSETGSGACIMNYQLEYSRSGKEEFLEGTYLGRPEVKGEENHYEWGSCGKGKVMLRKVTESSFYIEPFLRNNTAKPAAPKTAPTVTPPTVKKTTPPQPQTNQQQKNPPVAKTTPANPKNDPVDKNTKKDTVAAPKTEVAKTPLPERTKPEVAPAPPVIKNRQNELVKTLIINSPDVTIKIYDNGEIDDDTISVYLDNKLILSNKRLTATALTLKIKMDESNPDHQLTMVAENLGRIPPNTSLMIVEAGEKRFEVRITSTEQKNAVVKFHYQKE